MQPQQIVVADYLDILFENKNKDYGAYPLRKGYNQRLIIALLITSGIFVCALTLYMLPNAESTNVVPLKPEVVVKLIDPQSEKPHEIVPPPPPPPPPAPVATVKNLVPVIVPDKDARPEDAPPDVDELDRAKIGDITQKGIEDDRITAPPADYDRGIIEAPGRKDDGQDKIWMKVEIESSYPGGPNAWMRYLLKTFKYPTEAEQNGIEGSVLVRFIVDIDGKVSNVEAISGSQELRSEAVRVISKSGHWIPAIQNGNKVKSYKQQVISFKLE